MSLISFKNKTFTIDDIITFGRYKGEYISDIIKDDPNYLAWCIDSIDWFDVDAYLEELIYESTYWDEDYFQENEEVY